jgi:membrane protein implicated in regulation of membrane protease activity
MLGLLAAIFDMLMPGGILPWFGCLIVTCMLPEENNRSPLGGFIANVLLPLPAPIYAKRVPSKPSEQNGGSGHVANRHQQQRSLGCGRPLQEVRLIHH